MIYHLLDKPLRVMADRRVEWACLCGLRVALQPREVPRLTPIQTADKNNSQEVIECTACYAGQDEKGEAPPPVGAAGNERAIDPTLDPDLGSEDDDQSPIGEDDDGTLLKEESDEFPA